VYTMKTSTKSTPTTHPMHCRIHTYIHIHTSYINIQDPFFAWCGDTCYASFHFYLAFLMHDPSKVSEPEIPASEFDSFPQSELIFGTAHRGSPHRDATAPTAPKLPYDTKFRPPFLLLFITIRALQFRSRPPDSKHPREAGISLKALLASSSSSRWHRDACRHSRKDSTST
jgi:hypothetical protein